MLTTYEIIDEDELKAIAQKILDSFPDNRIFSLHGDLGAGKTTLVRFLCEQLEVVDRVVSPTFSLVNEYQNKKGEHIYHIDLYRIQTDQELYDLGIEEYLYGGSYCMIEWPERVEKLLPEGYVRIDLSAPGKGRIINVNIKK